MPIFIYNSLTRKKEEFVPINPARVNIYTCGVTVYDDCHIGHARSLYIFDVIRRYLRYRGLTVNFARNITDIDDKIIKRAKELKIDWRQLVEKYITRYYEDIGLLGIAKADSEPRATENIPEMIKYIQGLIDKGFAYVTETGVYFSVRKFVDYGKLSGQGIEEMLNGVRKESDETKKDPLDFALWKISKVDEPYWDSPFGKGRPGWHIECSVMSQKFLNTETLDIHAGGRDLIFPHHENEIAQAEALTGAPFAKYWIHHGLLTINSQKMAKSLGNFITIKDFLEKEEAEFVLKIFFLSAHYHSSLDYNEKAIHSARENAEGFGIFFKRVKELGIKDKKEYKRIVGNAKERFVQAMDDDFNTPVALSILFEMVSEGNKGIDHNNIDAVLSIYNTLSELLGVLNLQGIKETYESIGESSEEIANRLTRLFQLEYKTIFEEYDMNIGALIKIDGDEIKKYNELMKAYIILRDLVRKNKDFTLADKIRDDLYKKIGIILEDTKEGTTWRRKI